MNNNIKQTHINELENQLRMSEEKLKYFTVANLANALLAASEHFEDYAIIGPKLSMLTKSSADIALVSVATSEPYLELIMKKLKSIRHLNEDDDENNPYDIAKLLLAATEGNALEAISIIIELSE
jgi:hypothetical protein